MKISLSLLALPWGQEVVIARKYLYSFIQHPLTLYTLLNIQLLFFSFFKLLKIVFFSAVILILDTRK